MQNKNNNCPSCGAKEESIMDVIYFGLPAKFCDECSTMWGLGSYAPKIATETEHGPMFKMLQYDGTFLGYWGALWFFLFGDHDNVNTDFKD